MKKIVLFALCAVLFVASFFIVIGLQLWMIKSARIAASPTPTPQPQLTATPTVPFTSLNLPPRQSLTGKMSEISGTVNKTLRDSGNSVEASPEADIFEAESIIASPSAQATVSFGEILKAEVGSDSEITLASTNPAHFLIVQPRGSVSYTTDAQLKDFAVRSLHALITMNDVETDITVDPDEGIITVVMKTGNGQIGFIDADNNTQMIEIKQNERLTFDDATRTFKKKI